MYATYSPEDNKLRLYSTARLDDETYKQVRAAGFIYAPKQQLFVAPMWTPNRADLLTELCGEIGDEDTSLVDRAEERAERFDDYSDSRRQDAENARAAVASIADNIPLGQPILVGHHSAKHARRDAAKIENGMRRAVNMWETAQYWKSRAAGAIAAAKYKERPDVRARRIKGLESDIRVYRAKFTPDPKQPAILQHRWNDPADAEKVPHCWCAPRGGRGGSWVPVENLPALETHYTRWIQHCEMRLEYERAMLDEQGGTDLLKPKPRSAAASLPLCNYAAPGGLEIENIYRRGEFIHYPQVEMTQAAYAKINGDYKGTRVIGHSHRVRVAMQTSTHTLVCVFLTDFKTHTPPAPQEPAPREPRRIPTPYVAPEPTPQEKHDGNAATLREEIDAMRDQLKAGIQVVTAPQLFPTPPELADRMVEAAEIKEIKDGQRQRILEPSAGTGNLVYAIARAYSLELCELTAVEINDALVTNLASAFSDAQVKHADFLDLTALDLGQFDRIVMNPPFANADDVRHILNALEMLKPGGRLVAICANGPRQQERLRPLVEESGGTWEELDPDTFKESGTSVRAVLLTMDKPSEESEHQHAPGAPEAVRLEESEAELRAVLVDAARLEWGKWDAVKQKNIGEGDIHQAYSGDVIASGKIRGVITVDGQPYTVTGLGRPKDGGEEAHLWPLLTLAQWGAQPVTTYGDMSARCYGTDGDGPSFTYEGIKVKRGKSEFVMGARSGEIVAKAKPETAPAETAPEAQQHANEDDELLPDEDDMDDPDFYEPDDEPEPEWEPLPSPPFFQLDPTPAAPAQQLPLFGWGADATEEELQ